MAVCGLGEHVGEWQLHGGGEGAPDAIAGTRRPDQHQPDGQQDDARDDQDGGHQRTLSRGPPMTGHATARRNLRGT